MLRSDLLDTVASRLRYESRSVRPPSWYYGNKLSDEGNSWVRFKDADGVECAALCDYEMGVVVTVVKKCTVPCSL